MDKERVVEYIATGQALVLACKISLGVSLSAVGVLVAMIVSDHLAR